MSVAPYRDDFAALRDFTTHVGVAEALLGQFRAIPRRFVGSTATADELELLKGEARMVWEGLWDHLAQARAIAHGMGRGVARYDGARSQAADVWAAFDVRIDIGRTWNGRQLRTMVWRNAPVEPALEAIAALKAVVPEAVVTTPGPPPNVDLRQHGWLMDWWPLVVVLAIAGLIAWRCVA